MADIATAVGVVEGAIYKHFPSKRELLFRVMNDFYEPLITETREAVEGISGVRARLRFIIWRQLRAFTDDADLCRLVISEIRPLDDYYRSVVADLNRRYTAIAVEAISRGQEAGELRSDLPVTMIRDVIYGSIEHIAWRAVNGLADLDVDQTADDLTELLMAGLAPPEADSSTRLGMQVDRLAALLDRVGT